MQSLLVLVLATLAARALYVLAPIGVNLRLLHHLGEELLLLAASAGSFKVLTLLLCLHASIVKGVDSCIGSAVHSAVGGIKSLCLRCDGICNILV